MIVCSPQYNLSLELVVDRIILRSGLDLSLPHDHIILGSDFSRPSYYNRIKNECI
jgi:hypothetical protein